jgi:hypothetical protein
MSLGRPRALDDAKRREVCTLLTAGLELQEAARYVGCTDRTLRNEIRRSAAFRSEVQAALLSARLAPEKLLRQAAGRNWRAAAWLLERTNPNVYSRRPPGSCTLDDLDAACRWVIDVAMHAIEPQQRDGLFDHLTAIVLDAKTQVLGRSNSRQPLRTPPTVFYDLLNMVRPHKGVQPEGGLLSGEDDCPPEESRPPCDSPDIGGTSANADPRSSTQVQNAGLFSAETCALRGKKVDSPPSAERPPDPPDWSHPS